MQDFSWLRFDRFAYAHFSTFKMLLPPSNDQINIWTECRVDWWRNVKEINNFRDSDWEPLVYIYISREENSSSMSDSPMNSPTNVLRRECNSLLLNIPCWRSKRSEKKSDRHIEYESRWTPCTCLFTRHGSSPLGKKRRLPFATRNSFRRNYKELFGVRVERNAKGAFLISYQPRYRFGSCSSRNGTMAAMEGEG